MEKEDETPYISHIFKRPFGRRDRGPGCVKRATLAPLAPMQRTHARTAHSYSTRHKENTLLTQFGPISAAFFLYTPHLDWELG